MKNPEKMSTQELRNEVKTLKEWRLVGQHIINGVEDWTSGDSSNSVFFSTDMQEKIRELLK